MRFVRADDVYVLDGGPALRPRIAAGLRWLSGMVGGIGSAERFHHPSQLYELNVVLCVTRNLDPWVSFRRRQRDLGESAVRIGPFGPTHSLSEQVPRDDDGVRRNAVGYGLAEVLMQAARRTFGAEWDELV